MDLAIFLAKYGVIIEFSLIILIIIITYVMKMVYYFKAKNTHTMTTKIQLFLNEKTLLNEQITNQSFNKRWKNIAILTPIVRHLDRNLIQNKWARIRINFIRNIILPLARRAATKKDWIMRYYAAESFSLYSENGDEPTILSLLNDTVPLVSYTAANAAITYGSEAAITLIIVKMAQESWLTQSLYIQAFDNVSYATCYIVMNQLKNSKDPAIKATCYNILLKYPRIQVDWDINTDIQSANMLLMLAALRFIAHSQWRLALPILVNLLNDSNWQVKVVTLSCLKDLNAVDAIPQIIARLTDSNWWVRVAAAQALKSFGEPGEAALKSLNMSVETIDDNIADSVLNTL
jgi:hypothetical protein